MKAVPYLKIEDLLGEIRDKIKIASVEVFERKMRNLQLESHLYLVLFTNATNLNEVKNITALNNIRFKNSKKTKITQCHMCQQFGRGPRYCNLKQR